MENIVQWETFIHENIIPTLVAQDIGPMLANIGEVGQYRHIFYDIGPISGCWLDIGQHWANIVPTVISHISAGYRCVTWVCTFLVQFI